jgi:parallel beta-helix repeat protein
MRRHKNLSVAEGLSVKSKKASPRKRAFFLTFILFLVLIFGFSHQSSAGTVYVDDDIVCGGNTPCYSTIQAGINAASSGDEVRVYPGTYIETITMKSGVDVVSEGGYTVTTIDPPGTAAPAVNFIGVSGCTLDGFFIDASTGGHAFAGGAVHVKGYPVSCTSVTISNCDIYGHVSAMSGSSGIQLDGTVSVSITGNIIRHNSFPGIAVNPMSGVPLVGGPVTIKGNTIGISGEGNGGSGIFLKGAASGVQVRIGGSGIGEPNQISYTGYSVWGPFGGVGIRLHTISAVIIENNNIHDNTMAGILLQDVTTVSPHIKNNKIYDHSAGAGINIGGASNVTIGGNNDIYSNQAGIVFYIEENPNMGGGPIAVSGLFASSEPVVISGNDINRNDKAGIAVIDHVTGTITIDDNTFDQNSRSGIAFFNACTAVITDNEILKHTSNAGIYTGQWSPPYPQGGDGFDRSNGPANLTIKRNKVYRNRSGMRLDHASGTISNNLVYNNSRAGIRFSGDNVSPYEVFTSSWGITEIKNNTVVDNGGVLTGEDIGGGIVYDAFYEAAGDFEDPTIGVPPAPLLIRNNISAYNVKSGIRACFTNTVDSEERDYNLVYSNNGTGETDCGWPDSINMRCANKNFGGCGSKWNLPGPPRILPDGPNNIIGDPLFANISPGNEDYSLLPGSPAEGAGDDNLDMGAYGGTDPITW